MGSAGTFSWLTDWWRQRRAVKESAARRKAALQETLEPLIDLADHRIRAVSGYAGKLRPAMSSALEYVQEMMATIPGPLAVNPEIWNRDPTVNSLFLKEDDLLQAFVSQREAKEYFASPRGEETFALLTMDRDDRTVFASGRQGGVIRRDVARTSVTFKNHRLIGLSSSREETQAEIKMLALSALAGMVREEIGSAQEREEELERLENLCEVKLKSLGGGMEQENHQGNGSAPGDPEVRELRESLIQIRRERGMARKAFASYDDHLEALRRVLIQAPELLRAISGTTLLNEYGMIATMDSGERCHPVTLARITIGEERKREATLVRFKRKDFSATPAGR